MGEETRSNAQWDEELQSRLECVTGDGNINSDRNVSAVDSAAGCENASAAGKSNAGSDDNAPTSGATATGMGIISFPAESYMSGVKSSSFDSVVKRDPPVPVAIPGSLRSLRVAPIGISGRPRRVLRDPTDDSIGSDESLEAADRRRRSADSGGISSDSDDRKKAVNELPKHGENTMEAQSEPKVSAEPDERLHQKADTKAESDGRDGAGAEAELPKLNESGIGPQPVRKVLAEDSVHVSQSQLGSGEKAREWKLSSSWKPANGLELLRSELQALQMLNKQHRERNDHAKTSAPEHVPGKAEAEERLLPKPAEVAAVPSEAAASVEERFSEPGLERGPSGEDLKPEKRPFDEPRPEGPEKRYATYEVPLQSKDVGRPVPKAPPDRPAKAEEVSNHTKASEAAASRRSRDIITVNNKRYQRLGRIGSGGSSDVFKVIAADCTIYALKRINLKGRDHETAFNFYQEIEYLERLRGKTHIIQLIDYEVTDKCLFQQSKGTRGDIQSDAFILMVLEYGEIDLAKMLERKKQEISEQGRLDENWLRLYWEHILKAVNTIHEERIVHADLKPANFLLVQGVLKLIDFGIAKAIQNDTTHIERESQMGTVNYMSPEAFIHSKGDSGSLRCGRASDIWSLGCILYQMVYGRTPFSHLNFYQKITEITNPRHEIDFPAISNPLILDVIKSCLRWDKSKRPRIPELLEHPFLRPRLVSEEQQFIREAILQSCKAYVLLRGSVELAELVRNLLRGDVPIHRQQQHQLDEALLQLCRFFMHKYGKTALHQLLAVLL